MQGALVTLASDSGLTVSGTLEIGTANSAFDLVLAVDQGPEELVPFPQRPERAHVAAGALADANTHFHRVHRGHRRKIRFDLATSSVNGTAPLTWDAGAGARCQSPTSKLRRHPAFGRHVP